MNLVFAFLLGFVTISRVSGVEYNPICLNKSIEVNVNYNEEEKRITLEVEDQVEKFEIKMVHGIDGFEVFEYKVEEIVKNKKYFIELDSYHPDGQSFIVISVLFDKKGTSVAHSHRDVISIPVGNLNNKQIAEKTKRIKVLGSGHNEINRQGKIQVRGIKVHELPLQKK